MEALTVVEIEQVRPEDHEAVTAVVGAAFVHQPEVPDLVRLIRDSPQYVAELELVARVEGAVAGHTMISHAALVDADGTRHDVLTLSPLSVAPQHERQGIGSALVCEALARAERTDAPLILLEGSPAYYPRFGFTDARPHGITFDLPDWSAPEAGMVYLLPRYDPAVRGRVDYPPAFATLGGH
ncbi:MAG TPA: N-acetyltransferase [Actinomycetes bacterium]|nr:N-acetyltransferase [Actinomycetes bacterium]